MNAICRGLALVVAPLALFAATSSSSAELSPLCDNKSVLGHEFGSTRIVGKEIMKGPSSVLIELSSPWGPFKTAEINLTLKSRRVWGGGTSVTLEGREDAQKLVNSIVKGLEDSLKISERIDPDKHSVVLYTGHARENFGGPKFFHVDGLKIEVSAHELSGNRFIVFALCSELTFERLQSKEVFAN